LSSSSVGISCASAIILVVDLWVFLPVGGLFSRGVNLFLLSGGMAYVWVFVDSKNTNIRL
jgi:hypothetical protein